MLSWTKTAAAAAVLAASAAAQPALTTIQDVLYRADGTRFNGTLYITYESFLGGDSTNIATANLTVPIVNGVLRVRLAPTTQASAGAQYNVTYNSAGVNQFTETWAVPPSAVALRVRDVRIASGTVVGPEPVISPVQISDVVGLQNELEVRPMRGIGFALGRAAVINSSGQIDGASGNLNDCVRVDGSSGPCGGGGGGGTGGAFADAEVPAGTINGSNTVFALTRAPSPPASLELYRNGLRMRENVDYQLTGSTITFFVGSTPQAGDLLVASYRYADPNNPLSTMAAPQTVCSSVGASTSSTVATQLGSCTIPAGVLGTGDRLEIYYIFGHTGSSVGFTGEVLVGGATVASRTAGAAESLLVGESGFALYSGAQAWTTQSWGTSLALAVAAGSSTENTSQALSVTFRGQLTGAGSDTVALRTFTVIRYPAQANP
jgi:hypothetical protein